MKSQDSCEIIDLRQQLNNLTTETVVNLASRNIGYRDQKNDLHKIKLEILNEFLINNTSITALILSDNYLKNNDYVKIAQSLKNITQLEAINFSNYSDWEDIIFKTKYSLYNRVGISGCKALAGALKGKEALKELSLGSNKINDMGAIELGSLIAHLPNLTTLCLEINEIADNGGKAIGMAIKEHKNLHTLNLGGNKIGNIGCAGIAEGLQQNHSLKILNLSYNAIKSAGGEALGEALKINNTLEILCLSGNYFDSAVFHQVMFRINENQIGDEGGRAIGEALAINLSLAYLTLAGNEIGEIGFKNFEEGLKKNKKLEFLDIHGNNFTEKGIKYISKGLQENKTLTYLNLDMEKPFSGEDDPANYTVLFLNEEPTNFLDLSNQKDVDEENKISDTKEKFLAQIISYNPSLLYLNLRNHIVSETGLLSISEAFSANKTLSHLDLSGKEFSLDFISKLFTGLQNNSTLKYLDFTIKKSSKDNEVIFDLLQNDINNENDPEITAGGFDLLAIQTICEALKVNQSLHNLDLSQYKLNDEELILILDALKGNRALCSVNFSDNKFTNTGILKFSEFIKENIYLKSIKLGHTLRSANFFQPELEKVNEETKKILQDTLLEITPNNCFITDIEAFGCRGPEKLLSRNKDLYARFNEKFTSPPSKIIKLTNGKASIDLSLKSLYFLKYCDKQTLAEQFVSTDYDDTNFHEYLKFTFLKSIKEYLSPYFYYANFFKLAGVCNKLTFEVSKSEFSLKHLPQEVWFKILSYVDIASFKFEFPIKDYSPAEDLHERQQASARFLASFCKSTKQKDYDEYEDDLDYIYLDEPQNIDQPSSEEEEVTLGGVNSEDNL